MATDPRIDNEIAAVRSEIYSANTQASIVLATIALAVGPLAANAKSLFRPTWPITTLAIVGGVAAFAAVWLLLNVVLPRLDASGRGSFLHWAQFDHDGLRDALNEDYQLGELLVLSRIATAKYRSLHQAGYLLRIALVILAIAALASLAR
ncbi:Pycsar system effector family protein [Actinoplanes utahensis]|nr:Pycsar system effector family protein [Actinoplanes utahensis]GIF35245.1 hypothetical protein Aut01nite_82310 [Actinoplanes utahensis]